MRREDKFDSKVSRLSGSLEARREFYTVAQLSGLLQINERTLYRIIKTGQLRYHQIGRMMRFRSDDIEEFLRRRRVPSRDRRI
ncbi:MAG: helix-turn-helix domain-containing protein [Candidatus Binatus sp.]|uniref:helix-turn-helix domain-containing protein n=1 Tax=Candidatus Binatus sp. TaxID=2811406 RepID=UPI00271910AD|nr:helix-turn-helix domain-containing protein [Candidatus Binatus sp.]MDO8432675.1 helix-turn-helix domain-containing protein [Candidatus Binatus sp.]